MPRYFFHLRIGRGFRRDGIGLELAGPDAARDVARAAVETARCLCVGLAECSLQVADEAGRTLMAVPFGEPPAVTPEPCAAQPGFG